MTKKKTYLGLSAEEWFQVALPLILVGKGVALFDFWIFFFSAALAVMIVAVNQVGRVFAIPLVIFCGLLSVFFIQWAVYSGIEGHGILVLMDLLSASVFANGCAYFLSRSNRKTL